MNKSLVLGFFDGVHKAHRAVIESALERSDNTILITFKNSPAVYFGQKAEYILSRVNSLKKIQSLGVKEIVQLDFNDIAKWSADKYLKFLIDNYSPVSISTGFNHTFGLNKTGNPKFLENNQKLYNYKYICTPPIKEHNSIVSSTFIKELLKRGDVKKANSLLESNFIIEGTVIHGRKLGRTIGFPTANIQYPDDIVKLPFGVYIVKVLGHKGVLNWGIKPTVGENLEPSAEVHIIDFDKDLYNQNITLEVLDIIRPEKRFSDLEELKTQIEKDIEVCLKS